LTPEYREIALETLKNKINNADKKDKKYKKKPVSRSKHKNATQAENA
jgi:hypothetical protein